MDSRLFKIIGDAAKNAEKNGGDLTTKNLKYVARVAQDVSLKTGADCDELFAEGVIAMKKCEERYDPSKNDNFTKFCAISVRGLMNNYVRDNKHLVHVPANHQKGFKAGQNVKDEVSSIKYDHIDSFDYDTLGTVDDEIFNKDRYTILMEGIERLDENARIAIKMKLRLEEYANIRKNSMEAIAEELEVPVNIASRIYKDAFSKLTKYCTAEING